MIIFHANLNKMQTPRVPRISVWIRGKNNKRGCSMLVVRKHLLEANTYTYSNQALDKCSGWTSTAQNHCQQPDVQPCNPCSKQWERFGYTQLLWWLENHRQWSILPRGCSDRRKGSVSNPSASTLSKLGNYLDVYFFLILFLGLCM